MKPYIEDRNRKNAGFTLVELIVVIAILGILMGLSVPQLSETRNLLQVDAGIRQLQRDLRFAQQNAEEKQCKVMISFFTDEAPCKYVIRQYGKSDYLREGYLPKGLDEFSVGAITVLPDQSIQKNGHILIRKGNVSRYLYYYQTGRSRITAARSSG